MVVIEINEARIAATGMGESWWLDFRRAMGDRCRDVVSSIGGGIVQVACDDRDDATWLMDHMIVMGIHPSARRIAATHPTAGSAQRRAASKGD